MVVDPKPRRIAAALDRLFTDRGLASRLGEAGHRTLLATVPEWREVAERLLS
jgi:hypothetical protein